MEREKKREGRKNETEEGEKKRDGLEKDMLREQENWNFTYR